MCVSRCHIRTGSVAGTRQRLVLAAARPHPRVREGRDEARDRVLELERALLPQHHRRHRRDRLGHRVDAPQRVVVDRRRRPRRRAARPWRRARPCRRARSRRGSRAACLRHVARVVAVDAGQALGVEAGFGGVDLDGQQQRPRQSSPTAVLSDLPSFRQAGSGLIPPTSTGGETGCVHVGRSCWRLARPGGASRGRGARGHGGGARGLGDLRRGRPLGGQHQRGVVAHRRARRRPRTTTSPAREATPGLPSLQVGRGAHRRRRDERQPRLLRRAHVLARQRRQVQAGHRLLRPAARTRARRWRCRSSRRTRQGHQDRRRPDRRQRLRLRRHRPDLRDRLADVAVVVEELLPGRLEHDRDVLAGEHRRDHQQRAQRLQQRQARRWQRAGYADVAVQAARPDLLRAAADVRRASATARPASRARRSAAAASGTATPTGRATRSSNTLNTTIRNAVAAIGDVPVLDMVNALNGRKLCENTVGLLEEKGVANWTSAGRGRQERVGAPDPHADHALPALPAAGGRAPELLGPARAAQLLPPGLQRRRLARRVVRRARPPGSNGNGEPNMVLNQ